MEIVTIDLVIVPEESKSAFLDLSIKIQSILKKFPGFIEGFSYEKKDGNSPYNFMTTAVWKDQKTFENAGKALHAEFQKQHLNPAEFMQSLKIERIRSEYHRTPY